MSFQQKKWERVFNVFFDTNRSHELEWNDFELLIDRIKNLRGEDSKAHKEAKIALKLIWDGLIDVADKNKDLKISKEEWSEMWIKANRELTSKWQNDYLDYMFQLLDSSGDNLIDKAEYVQVMASYGITEAESAHAFDKIAEGKAGIDMDRFKSLWREYFQSTDTKAAGNYLFGEPPK